MSKPIMMRVNEKEKEAWDEFVAQCRSQGYVAKTTLMKILRKILREGKLADYAKEEA